MRAAQSFGVLLRRARRVAGLTQEELAERAGISADTISLLERGLTRAPHRETMGLLAGALALSPEQLADWEMAGRKARMPEIASAASAPRPAGNDAVDITVYCDQTTPEPPCGPPNPNQDPDSNFQHRQGLPPNRRRLPIPPTALIGRDDLVREVRALLLRPEVRLLTLTGSAGVGKTRLALQVAAELADAFADGVHFVPLAALQDPDRVLPAITEALGLRELGPGPVVVALAAALQEQQVLLVLDNFEQVIAAAPYLAALLESCAMVKLLVTSREVLHLRAEQQFVVPPLALPAEPTAGAGRQVDSAALEQNPAVQLFLQRAKAAQPGFELTPDNAAVIARICHRLEGIPLAIELAAPRLKLLSPRALLARLEAGLDMLAAGARDLPERQRTMRATIAWSYNLLSPAEQALCRRMAVFAGGWTLEAAEQLSVRAGLPDVGVLQGLSSLLDKSLLGRQRGTAGEPRFEMLHVVREYGLEQLEAEREGTAIREAHAAYYLSLAEGANRQEHGNGRKGLGNGLGEEHDNLRAALDWSFEHAERAHSPEAAERAVRLWWSLSPYWLDSCYRAGYPNAERVLALRTCLGSELQAKALLYAAALLRSAGETARADQLARDAQALGRD